MRLFFAIELDQDLASRLIDFQSGLDIVSATPVSPANYHVTLSFLGEVSEKQLDNLLSHLTAPKIDPFSVELTDLLFWPKSQVIALNVDDPDSKLMQLKRAIDSSVAASGFRYISKQKYQPHLTLFRKAEQAPEDNVRFSQPLNVREFSLMHSQNGKDGVQYQAIESWQLASTRSVKSQLLGRD